MLLLHIFFKSHRLCTKLEGLPKHPRTQSKQMQTQLGNTFSHNIGGKDSSHKGTSVAQGVP